MRQQKMLKKPAAAGPLKRPSSAPTATTRAISKTKRGTTTSFGRVELKGPFKDKSYLNAPDLDVTLLIQVARTRTPHFHAAAEAAFDYVCQSESILSKDDVKAYVASWISNQWFRVSA